VGVQHGGGICAAEAGQQSRRGRWGLVRLPEAIFRRDGRAPRQNDLGLIQEIRQVGIVGFLRDQGAQRLNAKTFPGRGRTSRLEQYSRTR
jgi:hypothetical protein